MRSSFVKRSIDVTVAACALIVSAPVLATVALLIRADMGSPVLFRQRRPGRAGAPFDMLKFRTMRAGVDSTGQPLPDELRLTKLGSFLRASSLDELPELWNVVRGDMSLVGPRPLLMEYLPLYSATQRRRHEVLPGITGWAQVNGRNAIEWEEKFALDCWYVDNWSNELDLAILLRTVLSVVRREGISQPGEATMRKFMGSDPVQ